MFNDYQFFEKMYFHELERKQHLENNTSLPTGAIVACFGLLGYFFTHFSFGGTKYWQSWLIEVIFVSSALTSSFLL